MTPQALAHLHARCFTIPRPFSAAEFTDLLTSDLVFLRLDPAGFALGRAVADEAELLTLAVDPDHRRGGIGRGLLAAFECEARQRGAQGAFLEVSAENHAARALYISAGYIESGLRRGYYRNADGTAADAVAMIKRLDQG